MLADLKKVAVLGSGAFGQVTLVRQGSKYYALKTLAKAQVLANGLQVGPLLACICLHSRKQAG